MPRKNIVKTYVEGGFYHIYNRGVNKQILFHTDDDYRYFIMLFGRYLSDTPCLSKDKYPYPWMQPHVELLAFCLMPNHFHLLVKQKTSTGITLLMRSLATAYSMYFKNQYHTVGSIFESRFKASLIQDEPYLTHISRYIHLNPPDYKSWPYSSYQAYLQSYHPKWLQPEPLRIILKDQGIINYAHFTADYIPHMQILKTTQS